MLSTNEQAQDKRSIFLGVFHAEIVSNIGLGLGLGLRVRVRVRVRVKVVVQ